MIFVDTSAWYAAYVPSDPRHAEVQPLVDHPRLPLVTTDWVLAESLTLLRVRGEDMRAIARGRAVLSQGCAKLLRVVRQVRFGSPAMGTSGASEFAPSGVISAT